MSKIERVAKKYPKEVVAVTRALASGPKTWDELCESGVVTPRTLLSHILRKLEAEGFVSSGHPDDGEARQYWLATDSPGYPEWLETAEEQEAAEQEAELLEDAEEDFENPGFDDPSGEPDS